MNCRLPTINKLIISGNLTDDPRTNILENGTHVANFRLANNMPYRDKVGEWKDKTCYVDVVCWRDLAERAGSRLHKGSPVVIEGELQYRQWEAQDGSKRSQVEIIAKSIQMVEKLEDSGNRSSSNNNRNNGSRSSGGPSGQYRGSAGSSSKYRDDIPF